VKDGGVADTNTARADIWIARRKSFAPSPRNRCAHAQKTAQTVDMPGVPRGIADPSS